MRLVYLILICILLTGCNKYKLTYNQYNKNDDKKGVWIETFDNGNYLIAKYRNGKLIGKVYGYSSNSELNYIKKYRNGKLHGWSYRFFDGSAIEEIKYKNDSTVDGHGYGVPGWKE